MRILLILFISLFISLHVLGQQTPEYPDSGFTNKAEAKNLRLKGEKEGKWILYSMKDEIKYDSNCDYISYTLIVYKAGKRYGVGRIYSRSGKLENVIPYHNDEADGDVKLYDTTTGKLLLLTPYKDGKMNGLQKVFYPPGGPITYETTVYHNDKQGVTKYYDSTGAEINKQ